MIVSFEGTLRALADSIVHERCMAIETDSSHASGTVANFLVEQYGYLPDYLRFPFKCLVLIFDAWGLLYTGRPFHCLPHERRWPLMQAWEQSSIGSFRDLMRFCETLSMFRWYSLEQ
jgi:hypothetical protein